MQITGRVTSDAVVRTTKSEKKVVGFNVAINENYKSNGEQKQTTTFFECSYWRGDAIAPFITKGTLIELSGTVGVNAYLSGGEAKASLTFRADNIKLHGKGNVKVEAGPAVTTASDAPSFNTIPVPEDDLPF
ncbi:MAG TPA: single-stranded DNA-binding protein [Pedobacter sp.]|uniref:single-stranded DNA-binding protein n=1 Tax=Pedobacter sp. TaxID=1411316 RepID=UPI002C082146|nr:single-stranded DNA-binding protein [Pedobacter sp.]HMI05314.1 single-stranded DNA-binding protein [Pedobacter sp.]